MMDIWRLVRISLAIITIFNNPNFYGRANENSYIAYVAPDDECSALNTAKRNIIPGEENLLSDVEGESPTIDPIFDGGTLTVSESGETAQDFLVNPNDGSAGFSNTIHNDNSAIEFSGDFTGEGGLRFKGGGETTLSGVNTYKGTTDVLGNLIAGSLTAIPKGSKVEIGGSGHLNLSLMPKTETGNFEIDNIRLAGVSAELSVSAKNLLKVENLTFNNGAINAYVFDKDDDAPIQIGNKFAYNGGTLTVIANPGEKDPEGKWKIIGGPVSGEEALAQNTVLIVGGEEYKFGGLGEDEAVDGKLALYQGYLEGGSLNLVIESKESEGPDGLECDLNPAADGCEEEPPLLGNGLPPLVGQELPDTDGDGIPDVIDPEPEKPCKGDECSVGNELPDLDGDGVIDDLDKDDDNDGIPDDKDPDDDGDGELDQLPGCEVGDDLCDIISDIDGDEDEASREEEEEVAV